MASAILKSATAAELHCWRFHTVHVLPLFYFCSIMDSYSMFAGQATDRWLNESVLALLVKSISLLFAALLIISVMLATRLLLIWMPNILCCAILKCEDLLLLLLFCGLKGWLDTKPKLHWYDICDGIFFTLWTEWLMTFSKNLQYSKEQLIAGM